MGIQFSALNNAAVNVTLNQCNAYNQESTVSRKGSLGRDAETTFGETCTAERHIFPLSPAFCFVLEVLIKGHRTANFPSSSSNFSSIPKVALMPAGRDPALRSANGTPSSAGCLACDTGSPVFHELLCLCWCSGLLWLRSPERRISAPLDSKAEIVLKYRQIIV